MAPAMAGSIGNFAPHEKNGITLVNPGCLYEYSPQKSFAYVVINNGKITAVINDKII